MFIDGSTAEESGDVVEISFATRSASLHGVFRGLDPPKSRFSQCSRTRNSCPRAATLAKLTWESVLESNHCSKGGCWGGEMLGLIGNLTNPIADPGGGQRGLEAVFGPIFCADGQTKKL